MMKNISKKIQKAGNTALALAITIGQYSIAINPNEPWTIGLASFLTLLSGAGSIAEILFNDIDIQNLKNQIEGNPENAKLFWSIIDAGVRETAKEKIKIYNSYLKGTLGNTNLAKDYNSKTLLVIQQITLSELQVFEKIYKNFKSLQIINLISSVDKEILKPDDKKVNNEEIYNWFRKFITNNKKEKSESEFLSENNFSNRPFNLSNLQKYNLFTDAEAQEVEMLTAYGLLSPTYSVWDGPFYKLTSFGKYVFNFLKKQKS